jgi:hypothetical protein
MESKWRHATTRKARSSPIGLSGFATEVQKPSEGKGCTMGEDEKEKKNCKLIDGKLVCDDDEKPPLGMKTSKFEPPMPSMDNMPKDGFSCDVDIKEDGDSVKMKYSCRPLPPKEKKKAQPITSTEGGEGQ